MSEREAFAANLKKLIAASSLSEQQVAERVGLSSKTLDRWLHEGLGRPDGRPRKPLQEMCRLLQVEPEELWADDGSADGDEHLAKLKEVLARWRQLGMPFDDIAEWIDRWYTAGRVAERFRREEPDLAGIVAKVKLLKSDGDVQRYLEGMVREWDLGEEEAYKRVAVTTQKFLAAAIPRDPDQLGLWFKRIHPRRWATLLARRKLDDEGELVAFIRHMLQEGLSPHEAYEGLIRLSSQPNSDK